MKVQVIDRGWVKHFRKGLETDHSSLRIICPFIKTKVVEDLLNHKPQNIQVITRFNLADFAAGVSDVGALKKLLEAGATVRGVRNLHSKLYIFGGKRAIITSANLTESALTKNHEFGMVSDDVEVVTACLQLLNVNHFCRLCDNHFCRSDSFSFRRFCAASVL